MRDPGCIFCRIVAGEIPSAKLYEDENNIAVLDINPVSEGHTLVIFKEHIADVFEMEAKSFSLFAAAVPRIARALKDSTQADGINVVLNNRRCSGQLIPHIHLHLIPRKDGDGLGLQWPAGKYSEGKMDEVLKKIKEHL